MVSFVGYKQFAGGEKKMEKEEETIRIKKSSLLFALQVLSLILFGDVIICKDLCQLLFISFQFLP